MYIQRNPCQPKASWWKKYTNNSQLKNRTIYVVNDMLGYEVDGFPQQLCPRELENGVLPNATNVNYAIFDKPIKILDKFYNVDIGENGYELQENDLVEDYIKAQVNETIKYEKNIYQRQFRFDISKEDDQQNGTYQPIQGLVTESSYLTVKTHNFANVKDKPQKGDLINYRREFWVIDETRESFVYTPKEHSILHLTIKKIKV